MAHRKKIGRNAPCPCGSGRKYKSCCRAAHERARRATRQIKRDALASGNPEAAIKHHLILLSNVRDKAQALLAAGDFDAAREAAHDVLRQFPGEVDAYELLATIAEADGKIGEAERWWRKALAHIESLDDYHPEASGEIRLQIERLAEAD